MIGCDKIEIKNIWEISNKNKILLIKNWII